jgi:hypothetical protein
MARLRSALLLESHDSCQIQHSNRDIFATEDTLTRLGLLSYDEAWPQVFLLLRRRSFIVSYYGHLSDSLRLFATIYGHDCDDMIDADLFGGSVDAFWLCSRRPALEQPT